MDKEKKIFVFADFQPYHEETIGTIYVSQTRGKEFYSFEYDQKWLEKGNMILDPDLQMYKGRQYIHDDKKIFGVFADSCPDRWGQRLMKRREELRAKNAGEKPRKLLDSDYLLGVYDEARMGGLRFKTEQHLKKIYRNCGSVLCLAWQCPIQTIILEIMDLFWKRQGGYFLRCMM